MQIEEYLRTYQPVIYKSFVRSLENDKLSHAYLIYGNNGTPIFEVAKFLAKSILCNDPSPLACDNCINCMRVDDDNYPDLIIFDGNKESIKKGNISTIETSFSTEAVDSKGIQIYVLNLIETMTVEAVNSLLKFLEEPHPNVYAFLTTNNINKVLPTIVSRCQSFQLKSINRKEVIRDAIQLGVMQDDAELLSYFYNEPNLILEKINDKDEYEDYLAAKTGLLKLLKLIVDDKREALFIMETQILPTIKNQATLQYFLDFLTQFISDVINLTSNNEVMLKCQLDLLEGLSKKIDNPSDVLIELLKVRGSLGLNVNTGLLLDHIVITLMGEKYGR